MKKPTMIIRVKELRREKSLTQEQLADNLGISRQSIIALENGRYMPSLPLACEIANFFDVALDQLLALDDKISNQTLSLTNQQEDNMRNRNLITWSPFRDLPSFSDEIDRFFDETAPFSDHSRLANAPAVNVRQDEKNIYIEANIPGYKEEEVDVDIADDYITITAEAKHEDEEKKKGYFRREFSSQSFTRTIPFPVPVDSGQAQAEIENGVLTVIVSRAEPEAKKTKKLEIKKR